MVFRVFIFIFILFYFIFCLEPTVRNNTWMRASSITVMVIFSKVPFCKFLDHSCVQSFFSRRHLRDTLQLKIFRKWVNIRFNTFLVKHHGTKINKSARKTTSCTKIQAFTSKKITSKQNMIFHLLPYKHTTSISC